jgi:hypothetical protein
MIKTLWLWVGHVYQRGNLYMFYFKEISRGSLPELAVLFRFRSSQISQQLRLGNQAHASTQTRILVIFP